MVHRSSHWNHKVTYSEDMKTFSVLVYGKQAWTGSFARRLTPEEIEAAENKP